MQLAIPMQFSKTTKNKTVSATRDGLVPTTNVYATTEYLNSHGIETKRIEATLSNTSFTGEEAGRMLLSVSMRASHTTKYKTVFASIDADAPVDTLYVLSEWLRSHDFGDVLYLGISDAASGDGYEAGQDAADAFGRFLDETITRGSRSRLTTERIWRAWASCFGVSPDTEEISGVLRREVAQLFSRALRGSKSLPWACGRPRPVLLGGPRNRRRDRQDMGRAGRHESRAIKDRVQVRVAHAGAHRAHQCHYQTRPGYRQYPVHRRSSSDRHLLAAINVKPQVRLFASGIHIRRSHRRPGQRRVHERLHARCPHG